MIFFFIWIGMEMISLLLLGFLFLKKSLKINGIGFQKMGVLVKYMFIQIISGMVIFFSFILSSFLFDVFKLGYSLGSNTENGFYMIEWLFKFMFFFSIFMKLGLFPGHLWVIDIFSGLSQQECFLLGIIPKYAPFMLLTGFNYDIFLTCVGTLSILSGSFIGLNYTDIRQIMGGSSIMNTGWLLMGMVYGGLGVFLFMYVIYSLSVWLMFTFTENLGIQSLVLHNLSRMEKMMFCLLMFIIMGMPCGIMFFFKIFLIMNGGNFFFFTFLMLMGYTMFVFYSRTMSQVWNYDYRNIHFNISTLSSNNSIKSRYVMSLVMMNFSGMIILFKFL
uniref:NADH-ubiquinone oxidoreductase chain 2 n=1 Tax=Ciona savignyi TaxID=51511 RepID=Q85UH9_CIOSA|nr:NADH dehydrogenase subunit 2 [Ciona savignyi]BAC57004.1 NADH dehydrogenase subunit 2 [Ciona savignyi]